MCEAQEANQPLRKRAAQTRSHTQINQRTPAAQNLRFEAEGRELEETIGYYSECSKRLLESEQASLENSERIADIFRTAPKRTY